MREIFTSDVSLKKYSEEGVTFRAKVEIAKLLDELGVNVIELPKMEDVAADSLLIKSIAGEISDATLAVNADIYEEGIDATYNALKVAKHPRLQIVAPVSPSRMEYDYHKKPDAMLDAIKNAIAHAKSLCDEVEFIANDATRADNAFLKTVLKEAILAGANVVSISDTAGVMLPEEMYRFIEDITKEVPALLSDEIVFGVSCSDEIHIADASALSAIRAGANEIKTSAHPVNKISLEGLAKILSVKGDELDAKTSVKMTKLKSVLSEIEELFGEAADEASPFDNKVSEGATEISIPADTNFDTLIDFVTKLGYDLNETDKVKIWEAFKETAKKKEVFKKDLEAIAATWSLQVPEEYIIKSYMVTTGDITDVVAHIKLDRDGEILDGVSLGNGPIDAAFLAIEKIIGRHFELEDFQIQAISEGREAMGETIVKLREHGKVYAGRGMSTDIIGSAISAYINALNKIVYEEKN